MNAIKHKGLLAFFVFIVVAALYAALYFAGRGDMKIRVLDARTGLPVSEEIHVSCFPSLLRSAEKSGDGEITVRPEFMMIGVITVSADGYSQKRIFSLLRAGEDLIVKLEKPETGK